MKKGLVLDIDRFSTHDGPGVRAAVFLKGCPLSCKWCHSPESQKATPELIFQKSRCTGCGKCDNFTQADACITQALQICGRWRTAEDVLETILPDKPFYDNSGGGVTVTGGEPLAQAEFTRYLLELCKQAGIHTALETCGYGSTEKLLAIARWCDMIFFDVKLMDDTQHKKYTGVSNRLILENLAALCTVPGNAGKITIRVPCVPGITDSPEQIVEINRLAKQHGIKHVEPMPYNELAGAKYEWLQRPYELGELKAKPKDYYKELIT